MYQDHLLSVCVGDLFFRIIYILSGILNDTYFSENEIETTILFLKSDKQSSDSNAIINVQHVSYRFEVRIQLNIHSYLDFQKTKIGKGTFCTEGPM